MSTPSSPAHPEAEALPLQCSQCGSDRFWRLPTGPNESGTQLEQTGFDLMIGGTKTLLTSGLATAFVCHRCGVIVLRVTDLPRFAAVAARPASNIVLVTGTSPAAPYR